MKVIIFPLEMINLWQILNILMIGLKYMDEHDDFYLRYVMARLAAFRNIWWSRGGQLHGKNHERIAFLKIII